MPRWSDWARFDQPSPYVDWIRHSNSELFLDRGAASQDWLGLQSAFMELGIFKPLAADDAASGLPDRLAAVRQAFPDSLPIPTFAMNNGFHAEGWQRPAPEDLPEVEEDTVIVGIVDTGIALGHQRFRNADGTTRVLAAWQQNAPRAHGGKGEAGLPFGREFYRDDINRLIADHSVGGHRGWLDEEAFNAAAGLVDMRHVLGHRELAGRFAHGTHVLDLAAGIDAAAGEPDAAMARRLGIIAVSLPTCPSFGFSGEFLDPYMVYGIQRIIDVADAIWEKNNPDAPQGGARGYPLVINISFGRQSGSKDMHDLFPSTVGAFVEASELAGSTVDIVMPVGNDNLLRCNAVMRLSSAGEPGSSDTLLWRVLPEDHTSNYVEIWSECFARAGAAGHPADEVPLELSLTPPGAAEEAPLPGRPDHVRRFGDGAAIYCQRSDRGGAAGCRYRYVLCTAPTLRQNGGAIAPAGVWKISVRNTGSAPVDVRLSVQSDQSILPSAVTGLRSYFEAKDYVRRDGAGCLVDSHRYGHDVVPVSLDTARTIRRRGTMNASAATQVVARVAGYRQSDGCPAPYSATGTGRRDGEANAGAPTAAFPTDDGPAHFGILAAGSRTGSTVAARGTSFASAQATRAIALHRLAGGRGSGKAHLFTLAQRAEAGGAAAGNPILVGTTDIEKTGAGRIPKPHRTPVDRTGR